MTKTIGIISIKGGVGKTSVTSALAASLANDFGKKVLVVDANFTAPNLGLQIGMVNPETTIQQVIDGKIKAKDAIYQTEYAFDILPGALIYSSKLKLSPFKLNEKLREIKRLYDFILIDSSPNLNDEILSTMLASDELLVVTTPDYVTLSTTLRAIKLAKEKKTPIIGLVLNKVYGKEFELSIKEIESASGASVLAVLPHDVDIVKALSKCVPSTLDDRNSEANSEYRKLAAALSGEECNKSGFFESLKKLFSFRQAVPKQDVNRSVLKNERKANPFYM